LSPPGAPSLLGNGSGKQTEAPENRLRDLTAWETISWGTVNLNPGDVIMAQIYDCNIVASNCPLTATPQDYNGFYQGCYTYRNGIYCDTNNNCTDCNAGPCPVGGDPGWNGLGWIQQTGPWSSGIAFDPTNVQIY
jgi:hypothetical protein